MRKSLQLFLFIFITAGVINGSGFQLNEHGARAMAMGGAFTGLANDPSAVYFNPAGITQLRGTNFYLGTTLIVPLATYKTPTQPAAEVDMEKQLFTPINFYITQQLTDKLHIGLGVNNPYGLGTKWDPNWVGKYLAVETELRAFYFTPVIAYQLSDQLSVSVGGTFAWADVTIIRKAPIPVGGDFEIDMNGDGTAFGFTAGLLYKPTEDFSLGLSYRSEVSFDFEGSATSAPAGFVHPLLGLTLPLPNGNIKAPLTTPQNITVGAAFAANDNLTLTADFQYVGWSSYDKLEVTFENYDLDLNPANGVQNVQSADRKYENSFIVRGGFEYCMQNGSKLRGGLFYDNSPVKDEYVEPTLPDADRIGLNIGYGLKLSDKFSVDVSYLYLIFMEREVTNSKFNFNGTYSNSAHLLGVNFAYSL
ncbi:MAG: OmpP1/FadL family transporter [Melioribacter sp.]|uniref:OmpP1/FadL family transporter n=1 Tax=Melioribacter sp. TaxID=2052167 RepID=UPI003BE96123